jgi:hypothetical protein
MSVGELLDRMTSRELAEWQAFDAIEPIGHKRGDVQSAIIAATVANASRDPKRQPYKVEDFIPFRERKITGWRAIKAKLMEAWG